MSPSVIDTPVTDAMNATRPGFVGQSPARHPASGAPARGSVGGNAAAPPPPPATRATGAEDEASGIPAFGTQIQVLRAEPDDYVSIFGVGDITGPSTSVAEIETTSHSTGNPHRTYIPTLIDDGELSFPNFWNPADPTQSFNSTYGLEYLFQNRLVTKFRLINTDQGHRTRVFRAFVRQLGETYPVQGVCTKNVTLRITSVPKDVPSPISMTPDSASALSAGGPESFDIATGGAVSALWMAVPDVSWIHIVSPTTPTSGDETVDYTVDAQTPAAPARVGRIMIAALGLTFEVSQAAGA